MHGSSTPEERSLQARVAAHTSWGSTTNRAARTAPARAARDQKFLDEAGGDPARAASLRKAYFARLALRSAQSRRRAKQGADEAAALDAELVDATGEAAELALGGPDAA